MVVTTMEAADDAYFTKLVGEVQIGESHLRNPQDFCVIESRSGFAVADDTNGVVLLGFDGQLQGHIKECKDAGSVCYNPTTNQIVVTVTTADDGTELHFYDCGETFKLWRRVPLQMGEKVIKPGYVRWVTVDRSHNQYYCACGDNENAVLVKYDVATDAWRSLVRTTGCLEHSTYSNVDNKPCVIAAAWTETTDWHVQKISLADETRPVTTVVIPPNFSAIAEPWSATVDPKGNIYAYDYKTGKVWKVPYPSYCGPVLIGCMLAGMWVSLIYRQGSLYACSSDEKCIIKFKVDGK